MNSVYSVLQQYKYTPPFYISEIGWNTASVSEDDQSKNVATAIGILKSDARVGMVSWFQLQDFGDTNKWGLTRQDGSKKPGWQTFVN